MKHRLQYIWNEISNIFTKEQSIYIMSYCIFATYFMQKLGGGALPKDFLKERALLNLVEPENYDVREAIFILEKGIDWVYMLELSSVRRLSEKLPQEVGRLGINTAEKVNQCMRGLWQLATAGGANYTPESVTNLISRLSLLEKAGSVGDFCCGFLGVGLEVWKKQREISDIEPQLLAVDSNRICCAISCILAWINGVRKFRIRNRDVLEEETENSSKVDLLIADVPKGMNDTYELKRYEERLEGCMQKSVYTDWVFTMDALAHLEEGGRAFVIVTKGALVRRNEKELRKMLVQRDWLEAVITLPPNLYSDTNMAMELVVFRKKREKTYQTFFSDLSEFVEKTENGRNAITDYGIAQLMKSYQNIVDNSDDRIGRWVTAEAISEADYSFNSMIYLELEKIQSDMGKSVVLGEMAQVIRGVQLSKEDEIILREDATHYLLNVKDIEQGQIFYNEETRIRGKSDSWDEKYRIREDDIIITSKGSLVKVAIVPPNPHKAYIMGNLTIIRCIKKNYHPYILYEFLRSEEGRKSMEGIQTGSTIKVLNVSQLQKMRIPAYETAEFKTYGEELKKNEVHYRQQSEKLKQEYEATKKYFMESLRRDCGTNEKNIY